MSTISRGKYQGMMAAVAADKGQVDSLQQSALSFRSLGYESVRPPQLLFNDELNG